MEHSTTNQFYSKTAITGSNGSGKTATALLLALGISAESDHRPVVTFDSEKRHLFWQAAYAIEKVPLLVVPGRSFKQLNEALHRARAEGACVWVGDSLTPPWQELVSSFALANGRIPIERQGQLRRLWNEFVVDFLDAPFHGIGCGRLGWEWLNTENEDGSRESYKGDPKLKAGGGESFGYECHLELEMRRHEWTAVEKKTKRRRVDVSHICSVVKDATGALSTLEFQFKPIAGPYKQGMYKRVYECFQPHLDLMKQLRDVQVGTQTSRDLLVSGETQWARDQRDRQIAIEKFDGEMSLVWGGQTAAEKRARLVVGHAITGTFSKTEMQESLTLAELQKAAEVMARIRQKILTEGMPGDEQQLLKLVELAKEGKNVTLLEVMGLETLATISRKKGGGKPQRVVEVMEQSEEVAGD